MIADNHSCTQFKDSFLYVLSSEKQPELIAGKCLGETAEELTAEFHDIARRGRAKKPCKHFYLAFAPEDGHVDVLTKADLAEEFLNRLGYETNQYAVIEHGREDPNHPHPHKHDHMHLIVNAVRFDNYHKTNDSWEIYRSIQVCRDLEQEYRLTPVNASEQKAPNPPRPHKERIKREEQEFEQGKRETPPEPYIKGELQAIINKASSDRPELPEFFNRLIEEDVIPNAYITEKGRKRISYHYRGFNFRGSKLKEASFPKLIKNRGINYDPDRDEEAMAVARQGNLNFDYIDQAEPETKDSSGLSPSPNPEVKENSNEQRILSAIHQLLQSSKQDQIKLNYESYGITEKIARDGDNLTYTQNIQGQERVVFHATSPDGGNSWDVKTNQFSTGDVDELENKVPSLAEDLAKKAKDQKQLKPKQKQKQNQLEL